MLAEFTERSIGQIALIAALAYAERAGIVICSFLFFFNENRDFWTFWGLVFVAGHLLFLSPVYGILLYFSERAIYGTRRRRGFVPQNERDIRSSGRIAGLVWLPVMALCSWQLFRLFDRMAPAKGPVDFWHGLFT